LTLILFGFAEPSLGIAIACLLVTGGAVLAARDVIFSSRKAEPVSTDRVQSAV
jgi:hypothetical protein